ncbi:glycoside hydrolase family 25 protein [Piscirickettsia litoralis]|uniref:glycoside hydrolase family 25 protein n=1 Tax=Piscirickettsia litoralis TaxID=1891921 RepID=UPI001300E2F0|nr:GH25 family lysozyme [Piscirickettsia litoralis]
MKKVQQLFPDNAYGVDVSKYQGKVNWPQLREQIDFVFVKATEGVNTTDTYFLYNWQQAKRHGITRGAYHFFHGHISGSAQAQHLINTVGKYHEEDLPLVVDVESARTTRFVSPKEYTKQLQAFIDHVKRKTGDEPIIYTNYYFWQSFLKKVHMFFQAMIFG